VVHGEQEFSFGEVVRSGDVITTSGRIENIYSKTNREGETNKFLVVATTSVNQNGQMVCDGKWTLVERQETAT
ncbi:MAG: MaoC family dehydratase N-terminal domain-containing protein, partial [Fidelibacterota bacterium]